MYKNILFFSFLAIYSNANEFSNNNGNNIFKENQPQFINKKDIKLNGNLNKDQVQKDLAATDMNSLVKDNKKNIDKNLEKIKLCEDNAKTKIEKDNCWKIDYKQKKENTINSTYKEKELKMDSMDKEIEKAQKVLNDKKSFNNAKNQSIDINSLNLNEFKAGKLDNSKIDKLKTTTIDSSINKQKGF